MTELYRHLLEYEARAACQFNQNTAHQWARNVSGADSWKTIIETIKELKAGYNELTRIIATNDVKEQQIRTYALNLPLSARTIRSESY